MFCYQCEQTARGKGCTVHGVCGKDAETAARQDLLTHLVKGIAMSAHRARKYGAVCGEVDSFVLEALFATVTNVNFDPKRLQELLVEGVKVRQKARSLYEEACLGSGGTAEKLSGAASWEPVDDQEKLLEQAEELGINVRRERFGEDVAGVQELIYYGLKGAAAYAYHAHILGQVSDEANAKFLEILDFLASDPTDTSELLGKALETGELNLTVMGLLDAANTETYGHPEPTAVRVSVKEGKAILVSGHELKDLEELLKQTEGKGVNVYTHGEMLPANSYPGLKKYSHLAGNYGGAWQNQQEEFDAFPGAILMTTNCIQKPAGSYIDRIFTSGPVAWPGVKHVSGTDFSAVIDCALDADGFAEDKPEETITIGFGRNTVLGVADKIVAAVKSGAIKHFFLIGGCDGAKPGRNYYTELAESVPDDCVILTLACGKYRFNKLDFGEIGGIPRLLDVGQCNDAYSAVQIVVALAGAFETDVNSLPLSIVCSWYEQKAVSILLSLFHLGIKGIRLGPTLPAFITPAVLNILVDKFEIAPISTAKEDLSVMLG